MADEQTSVALTPVDSSQIAAIGYEPGRLWVQFKTGGTYVYKDVGYGTYMELMAAESKGKFLQQEIKGHYEYEKVG